MNLTKQKALFIKIVPFVCLAALVIYTIIAHRISPVWDHFHIIGLIEARIMGTWSWSQLFMADGGHWHVGANAFMSLLAPLTHWNLLVECAINIIISMFAVWLFSYNRNLSPLTLSQRLALGSFLFFSLDQAGNWVWGWQIAVFLNVLGVMIVLCALCRDKVQLKHVIIAILGLILAIYNFTTGLALIPIGIAVLIYKRNLLHLSIWLSASIAVTAHYYITIYQLDGLSGLSTPGQPITYSTIGTVLFPIHFTINYLSAPITRFASDLAIPFVLISLLLSGMMVQRLYEEHRSLVIFALSAMAYATGAGLLTSFGRYEWGVDQAFVSRYITFSNFYWLGFAILLLSYMRSTFWSQIVSKKRHAIIGFALIIIIFKCINSLQVAKKTYRNEMKDRKAWEQIIASYPNTDDAILKTLYWDADQLRNYLDVMQRHKLNRFYKGNISVGDSAQ